MTFSCSGNAILSCLCNLISYVYPLSKFNGVCSALTGDIPLDTVVREGSDSGQPVTIAQPHGEIAKTYHNIAQEIWTRLS